MGLLETTLQQKFYLAFATLETSAGLSNELVSNKVYQRVLKCIPKKKPHSAYCICRLVDMALIRGQCLSQGWWLFKTSHLSFLFSFNFSKMTTTDKNKVKTVIVKGLYDVSFEIQIINNNSNKNVKNLSK